MVWACSAPCGVWATRRLGPRLGSCLQQSKTRILTNRGGITMSLLKTERAGGARRWGRRERGGGSRRHLGAQEAGRARRNPSDRAGLPCRRPVARNASASAAESAPLGELTHLTPAGAHARADPSLGSGMPRDSSNKSTFRWKSSSKLLQDESKKDIPGFCSIAIA